MNNLMDNTGKELAYRCGLAVRPWSEEWNRTGLSVDDCMRREIAESRTLIAKLQADREDAQWWRAARSSWLVRVWMFWDGVKNGK